MKMAITTPLSTRDYETARSAHDKYFKEREALSSPLFGIEVFIKRDRQERAFDIVYRTYEYVVQYGSLASR